MRQRSLERSRPSILNEAPFLFASLLLSPSETILWHIPKPSIRKDGKNEKNLELLNRQAGEEGNSYKTQQKHLLLF